MQSKSSIFQLPIEFSGDLNQPKQSPPQQQNSSLSSRLFGIKGPNDDKIPIKSADKITAPIIQGIKLKALEISKAQEYSKDVNNNTKKNKVLSVIDVLFTIIYSAECFLKIIALGLVFHKNSYLRDPWNNLDFFVVLIGLVSILPSIPNLKALRTLRVLRPLRSIKAVPSMKRLVGSLLLSIPQMLNVVLFLLFMFLIFGILGILTFQGDQYHRCRLTKMPYSNGTWPIDQTQNRLCGGLYQCLSDTVCGSLDQYGIDISKDDVYNDPLINYNINNFDNIFYSILTIFQAISLEGWTQNMYNYMDSSGIFAAIFFPVLIIIVSFFLLNLFLAVIMNIFTEMDNRQKQLEAEELRKQNALKGIKKEGLLAKLNLQNNQDQKNQKKKLKSSQQKKPNMVNIFKNFYKLNIQNELQNIQAIQKQNETINNQTENKIELKKASLKTRIQKFFLKIFNMKAFQASITISIVLNTICLALDKYPQDEDLANQLDIFNFIFCGIFFIELIVKLIGLGIKGYIKDKQNLFDGFIVIISVIDIAIALSPLEYTQGGAVSAFRAFRLLRIFKLAKQWQKFQELLKTILNSLKDISNFSILMFLFMFTYVLLGMELFANQVKFNSQGYIDLDKGESPRTNFDTFFEAFITIFIVLTGENWDAIMYDFTRARGNIAIFYFVTFVILGQLILLNLFLAILLKNFDESSLVERKEHQAQLQSSSHESYFQKKFKQVKQYFLKKRFIQWLQKVLSDQDDEVENEKNKKQEQYLIKQTAAGDEEENKEGEDGTDIIKIQYLAQKDRQIEDSQQTPIKPQRKQNLEEEFKQDVRNSLEITDGQEQEPHYGDKEIKKINHALNLFQNKETPKDGSKFVSFSDIYSPDKFRFKKKHSIANIITAKVKENQQDKNICNGRALYCLKKDNRFRIFIARFVQSNIFEYILLFIISIQSILLALDNPLNDPDGQLVKVLYYSDIIFTCIFFLEFLLKIITFGFLLNGSQSYLRVLWNIGDFVILVLSILSILYTDSRFKSVKAIRLLRVLKPLRIISKNQGLKIAVSALLMAIPHIINVIIISLLFFLIFGIIGVNYLKGAFYYCNIDNDIYPQNIIDMSNKFVINKFDCLNIGGLWINRDQNFDNIIQAIVSLFQVATTEGWVDVMHYGIDAVAIDYQPIKENMGFWAIYFIFFIIVGNFFVLNLFVGVVISTFNREKEVLGKNFLLTSEQKQWVEQKKLVIRISPKKLDDEQQDNPYREKIRKFASSKGFEMFIIIIIILNILAMTITWYGQSNDVTKFMENLNYFFAAIYVIEACIKLIGLGIIKYFKDRWNCFDFFIVLGTLISIFITAFTPITIGAATTFIRAFRISRLFRLIKKARRLKIIFETFIITIPALTNVGGLLMLFLYIYSILGVFLFAQVKLQENLDEHANFQTFGNAFLTLIRCATGEAWNAIMIDSTRTQEASEGMFQCNDDDDFSYDQYVSNGFKVEGCGNSAGYLFFTSYFLIVPLIFLNLFIAIIIQGFEDINQKENLLIKEDEIENFRNGTGFINIHDLPRMLLRLGDPLGWDSSYKDNLDKQDDFFEEMHISTYNSFRHYLFWDVLQSLTKILIVKRKSLNKQQSNSQDQEKQPSNGGQEDELENFEQQIQIRMELEFENYDEQKNEVLVVQDLKKQENTLKKNIINKRDAYLTSSHLKAGRKIYQAMFKFKEKFLQNSRNKRASKTSMNEQNKQNEQEQEHSNFGTEEIIQEELKNDFQMEKRLSNHLKTDRPANQQHEDFEIDQLEREFEEDSNRIFGIQYEDDEQERSINLNNSRAQLTISLEEEFKEHEGGIHHNFQRFKKNQKKKSNKGFKNILQPQQ